MKVLVLPIKKIWFDKIFSLVKKEEYREIKPYYTKRFKKQYDAIEFRNGYGKSVPNGLIELIEIVEGTGNVEWGAEKGKKYYVLKMGNVLKSPQQTTNKGTKNGT